MKNIFLIMIVIIDIFALDTQVFLIDNSGVKRELIKTKSNDMSLYESNNISRKSIKSTNVNCESTITILKDDQFMHIDSDEFGPAPVEIIIFDLRKKVLYSGSESADKYNFNINLKNIKDAKIVQVSNYFGDIQFCKQIVYK